MDPHYKKFKNLTIINQKKEQIFNPPQKQWVQGAAALVFESKNKIELSEFSEDSFQLVDEFDRALKSGKVVIETLPRASPEQLYREGTSSKESMNSHIYIYTIKLITLSLKILRFPGLPLLKMARFTSS